MYKGYSNVSDDKLEKYFQGFDLDELVMNQYVVSEDEKIYRFDGKKLDTIKTKKLKNMKAKNIEQKMAFDLLDRKDVPIKILIGPPGTGKSAIGLAFGVDAITDGDSEKLIVVRHNVESGRKLGHLPGTLDEKSEVWVENIIDLLEGKEFEYAKLKQQNKIEIQMPAMCQGKNFRGFTLVDECQNLSKDQVLLLGSRIVDNGQIVFCGDTNQIADREFKTNNGLKLMLDKLVGHPLVGVVMLTEVVRGPVAAVFAKLLEDEKLNG